MNMHSGSTPPPTLKFFGTISPFSSAQEFVPRLELKEGETVLDAGSGLGGSAFFMAEVRY